MDFNTPPTAQPVTTSGLFSPLHPATGFGAIFTYMAAMLTSVMNFSVAHRGKVVGILDASFSAGPALMALLYGEFFTRGHIHDEENQDLRGFYLTSAIAFIAINALGAVFLGVYRKPDVVSLPDSSGGCVVFSAVSFLGRNTVIILHMGVVEVCVCGGGGGGWGRVGGSSANFS